MDTERIERLAIDRALGELNEDAAVLFDTYLAEHPEMQTSVKGMMDICARTEAAFAGKMQEQDTSKLSLVRTESRWIDWLNLGRWAAVIVVSVSFGITLGRRSRPDVVPTEVTITQAASTNTHQSMRDILSRQTEGFWQSKALALLQTAPHVTTNSRDPQTSLWGRYQQLRKERSYE